MNINERIFNFSNQIKEKNKESFSKICVRIVKELFTQDFSAVAVTDVLLQGKEYT